MHSLFHPVPPAGKCLGSITFFRFPRSCCSHEGDFSAVHCPLPGDLLSPLVLFARGGFLCGRLSPSRGLAFPARAIRTRGISLRSIVPFQGTSPRSVIPFQGDLLSQKGSIPYLPPFSFWAARCWRLCRIAYPLSASIMALWKVSRPSPFASLCIRPGFLAPPLPESSRSCSFSMRFSKSI